MVEARPVIPVSAPAFLGNEKLYVQQCLDSTWISSIGEFIERFEGGFAKRLGVPHAISCCNGTVALHLALLALGIGKGDEVLVPSLTYVASANAITYTGAHPVFVDSDLDTWNVSVEDLERKVTPRTRAILIVHLYGRAADMDGVLEVSRRHGLRVIEDVAEAMGGEYRGQALGTLGDVGAFSFFGNKIVTCGEGGMVVTRAEDLARRIRQLKGQGQDPARRYWFPIIGYNYRMTNIAAAIGLAQLECLDEHLARRDAVRGWYDEALSSLQGIRPQRPAASGTRSVCWLYSVVLSALEEGGRDRVMEILGHDGIDTRPFFYPCHILPPYRGLRDDWQCPRALWLASRGVSLPTYVGLTRTQVRRVAGALAAALPP
jgi:perosamine synthetase